MASLDLYYQHEIILEWPDTFSAWLVELATGICNNLFMMDEGLLSIISAGCGLLRCS